MLFDEVIVSSLFLLFVELLSVLPWQQPTLHNLLSELSSSATPSLAQDLVVGSTTSAEVHRVIDGDTIELESGEKVRYIGIDTPETKDPRQETQCFGQEAFQKNRELVEGKMIILERDISNTDRYGRLLRYVYVDDVMVNEELVLQGYAAAASYPPDIKHQERLKMAESLARQEKLGLWSMCAFSSDKEKQPGIL